MNRFFVFVLSAFLVLAGSSCRHQKAATNSGDTNNFGNSPKQRDDAITANKADEQSVFIQGCIEKSLGNYSKALGEFQEVLNMNPDNAAANYEVAGMYWQLNQADRALKYAQKATQLNPDNQWYKFRYAELLQVNGKDDEATKIFQDMSDADPGNVDLLYRYAASLTKAKKYDDALKTYDRIEAIQGISDTLTRCRITIYHEQKDIASEEKALVKLVDAFPEEMDYYIRLSDFYTLNGMPAKAAEIFRKMTVVFPYDVTPHLKLADYYYSQKQYDKAFAEAEHGFEEPDDLNEKIDLFNKWYPLADSAPALTPARQKEADSLCRVLRRIHPDEAGVYVLYGNLLYKNGKFKDAREQYHKATSINPDMYEPWKRIMMINDQLKDNATQEKDCKDILELFPAQPDAYFYLGMIQYGNKQYSQAADNISAGVDYLFDDPQKEMKMDLVLIDAYRHCDKDDKADDLTEKILAKDTANYALMASYSASLLDRGMKLYNAEKMMLKVVAHDPSAANTETLAWLEFKLSDYAAAKTWMSVALTKDPNNARMNERMGDIQYRLGNADDAMKYWKKAKEKGGSNPDLDKKISTGKLQE
ncbi:MAG TPA: tetratricopeptide repeat protein [Bacteroidia bacterium]|nr:tetratricopeptide repeat protein [Bacteroidia bacterium]